MTSTEILQRYSDPELIRQYLAELKRIIPRPVRLMEVCGTHTMALFESGLRQVLGDLGVELLSGPGCPVCVTSAADIDFALALAQLPETTLCTFGDMLRVPGSLASLAELRAQGADVRVVYSPLDAVELAQAHPQRRFIFLGIGFETTIPAVAYSIKYAQQLDLSNYSIFVSHKVIPPALAVLAQDPELRLDGFICPGHVSVIIGARPYEPVAKHCGKPCVITGFEPLDLAYGVLAAVRQIAQGVARVENMYRRVVHEEGNAQALALITEVFAPASAEWRGLGVIPLSGLALRQEHSRFDARLLLPDFTAPPPDPALAACRCGDVLKGLIQPDACSCFRIACTPEHPLGACMVSQEGACRAYYRYRGKEAGS
jgi:hydrogenase expression/formation protein HypD